MYVEVRTSFIKTMKILEAINPFLVVLSIIGMFLDYSNYSSWVVVPNQVISVLFVVDFIIRLMAHNPGKYFFNGYGWVDFIASLPGFMFFLENTPLFSIFKILRIGKFFKIIRILRFLRIFNFLKRMKTDSPWVQDRIMQVGVVIVLVFVSGIVIVDNRVGNYLNSEIEKNIRRTYKVSNNNLGDVINTYKEVEFYILNKKIFYNDKNPYQDQEKFKEFITNNSETYISLGFSENNFILGEDMILPEIGIILNRSNLDTFQNSIMVLMLSTLLVILVVMIFYMGFKFAKDVQIVQLVIDSLEAKDNLLLKEECNDFFEDTGELVVYEHDSEMINLLKVATNSLPDNPIEDALFNMECDDNSFDTTEIISKLDDLDEHLDAHNVEIVKETIKRVLPGILSYIDKHYK